MFADSSVDFSRFSVAPDEAWLEQPLFAGQLRPPMGFPIGKDIRDGRLGVPVNRYTARLLVGGGNFSIFL